MPSGGSIAISAHNAPRTEIAGKVGDFVSLRVRDTGTGMSPEVRARAFEPFFTTKETGKGSGLGLAQVYGFTTQSGGEVRIDSREGHGTVVTLLLPRTERSPIVAASREAPPPSAKQPVKASVLFVEDDPEVAALTGDMLRELGLDVLHVGTAAGALDALSRGHKVDILFSDMMIPGGMSGLELAGEFRRRRPAVPIVLTTGLASWAVDARAADITLLLKPYGSDELGATLRAELKRAHA